ncbi:type II toxin-antitoxin system PemK/MazF family toxin [Microbacterium soli]|uniref:PemK domain-containing protein n=1 Tax=Microbacterium soli TaxID=446075 RepID=A0ABP7NH31_9MICO
MSSTKRILSAVAGAVVRMLVKEGSQRPASRRRPNAVLRPRERPGSRAAGRGPRHPDEGASPGQAAGSQTIQVDPERVPALSVAYAPVRNDVPNAGEVIWTWVPYEENDGRGKDRPVLVIGRQSANRVYAVRMTSKAHDGDRDYLSIGSGGWDSRGRESWVDIEQLYSVHDDGMRREAAALDRARYDRVAQALVRRYGWARA